MTYVDLHVHVRIRRVTFEKDGWQQHAKLAIHVHVDLQSTRLERMSFALYVMHRVHEFYKW